ncbi:cytochrome aa3 quinol oxidase subunit IV [Camelliibacillus cellulosilyticus]|uniref:Quinol oxidase subunit 4 n=1 Tax=Camelliibacillus cellulosilyticus TaxID=2174486 RepID=A0ABV9GP40_9BACL
MEQNAHVHDDHKGFPWKHVIGFFLSIVLTFAALFIVLSASLPTSMTIAAIVVLAIFQVLVQLMLFMHLNEHEGAFQITAIAFGFFVAFAIVVGSIWIVTLSM